MEKLGHLLGPTISLPGGAFARDWWVVPSERLPRRAWPPRRASRMTTSTEAWAGVHAEDSESATGLAPVRTVSAIFVSFRPTTAGPPGDRGSACRAARQ